MFFSILGFSQCCLVLDFDFVGLVVVLILGMYLFERFLLFRFLVIFFFLWWLCVVLVVCRYQVGMSCVFVGVCVCMCFQVVIGVFLCLGGYIYSFFWLYLFQFWGLLSGCCRYLVLGSVDVGYFQKDFILGLCFFGCFLRGCQGVDCILSF